MKYLKHIIFVFVLFFIDLISKEYFMLNFFDFKFLSLHYVQNSGAVFGLFSGLNILFLILTLIILCVILYFYKKENNLQLGFDFVIAGALGNGVNRVLLNHVVDFIDFKFWPVFNFADVFVVVGVVLLVFKLRKE